MFSFKLKISGITVFCFLVLTLGSCNKKKPHKLEDGKESFVGTWNWVYSSHYHNHCDGGPLVTDILTPETEGHEFKIIFEVEGKISYYQDEILISTNDTYFVEFDYETIYCENLSDSEIFAITYSYEGEREFAGCQNSDTIRTNSFDEFLFPYTPGCESYNNFFVKE